MASELWTGDRAGNLGESLLKEFLRPDAAWCANITYIPVSSGFLYLVTVMDWASRYVLAWRLSNTMDSGFCVEALEAALQTDTPEIFNTDQGAQFTTAAFTGRVQAAGRGARWTVAGSGWTTSSSSGCGAR